MRFDLGGIGRGGARVTVNLHDNADIYSDFVDLDKFCSDDSVEEFYLSHALEHVPAQNYAQFLRDLLKKLRPGGVVLVVQTDIKACLDLYRSGSLSFLALRTAIFTPADRLRQNPFNHHFNMWGAQELAAEFAAVGFTNVRIFDAGSWPLDTTDEMHPGEVEKFHAVRIPNLGIEASRSGFEAAPESQSGEDLSAYEHRVFSKNGSDGVLCRLMNLLSIRSGAFFEINSGGGETSYTRILRDRFGFTGFTARASNRISLSGEMLTCSNAHSHCNKLGVPQEVDLLTIDASGNDFWIWESLSQCLQANVVIIEYNAFLGADQSRVVPYDSEFVWTGSDYFGASICALTALGRSLGYRLIYSDKGGEALFFVLDKTLSKFGLRFAYQGQPTALHRPRLAAIGEFNHDQREVPLYVTPPLIPRVIHQTWKTHALPDAFRREWQDSWREMNPDWEYRFWTDDDIDAFVRENYPVFHSTFIGYDVNIKRVDAFRYLVMKVIGGVYTDLDSMCLRPLDSFLEGHHLLFGCQYDGNWLIGRDTVCNAFIASAPDHPFWDGITIDLGRHAQCDVLDATGPNFLTGRLQRALAFIDETAFPAIVERRKLYPFPWNDSVVKEAREMSRAELTERYAESVAVNFWTATWK